jgi:Lhr-like helicase
MYDSSNAINGLFVNGKEMWFDKVTRTCINYSIQVEKNSGQETTVLFYEGEGYTLPIDLAIQMFSALELYAKACYNKTEEHKNNIKALDNIEDLLNYNIKSGYPEKLSFNV